VWNLPSHITGRTQIDGVWEKFTEKNICSNREQATAMWGKFRFIMRTYY